MKVLFTGDFLRPKSDGSPGSQIVNIQWLADYISPAIRSVAATIRVVTGVEYLNRGYDWLPRMGLPCSEAGWLAALDLPDWSCLNTELESILGDADLVLGFEMPEQFKKYIRSKCRTYIDFAISPYRFCDDIFLMASASSPVLVQRLAKWRMGRSDMTGDAGALMARIHRETSPFPSHSSLVVFGQSEIDRSIRVGGRVAKWADFEKEVSECAKGVSVIYFKPHPYSRPEATSENVAFFSRFANVVLLKEHAYVTLSRPELTKFITLSSSVAFEADFFGRRVVNFMPLPYSIAIDGDANPSDFIVLGSCVGMVDFWMYVLKGDSLPVFKGGVCHNKIRDSLGPWWSFEGLDRSFRVSKWANASGFDAIQSDMKILQLKVEKMLQEQSDFVKIISSRDAEIASRDRELREMTSSLAHKDAVISHRDAEIQRWQGDVNNLHCEIDRLRRLAYDVPWHTHLFRSWKRLVGDIQYNQFSSTALRRYNNLQVPWHTHLYRAGLALFVKGEKPWHTHLYRALRSTRKDARYAPALNKGWRIIVRGNNVPLHTHLWRSVKSLFGYAQKPFHVHLWRAWRSALGDPKYAPLILPPSVPLFRAKSMTEALPILKANYVPSNTRLFTAGAPEVPVPQLRSRIESRLEGLLKNNR